MCNLCPWNIAWDSLYSKVSIWLFTMQFTQQYRKETRIFFQNFSLIKKNIFFLKVYLLCFWYVLKITVWDQSLERDVVCWTRFPRAICSTYKNESTFIYIFERRFIKLILVIFKHEYGPISDRIVFKKVRALHL